MFLRGFDTPMHTMNHDIIGVHIPSKILGPPFNLAPPNYFGLKFLGPHLKIVFFGGGRGCYHVQILIMFHHIFGKNYIRTDLSHPISLRRNSVLSLVVTDY